MKVEQTTTAVAGSKPIAAETQLHALARAGQTTKVFKYKSPSTRRRDRVRFEKWKVRMEEKKDIKPETTESSASDSASTSSEASAASPGQDTASSDNKNKHTPDENTDNPCVSVAPILPVTVSVLPDLSVIQSNELN